jgi:hypothetical protein
MKKPAQKNSRTEAVPAQKNQMDYDQEVNRRAYELWEAAGGQHGDDLRHWLEAEREVKARRQSSGAGSR